MANITITNCDSGSVFLPGADFRDETLAFAAADTFVAGTILARRKVVTAITPAAGANTGNGTCTLASVVEGPVVPLVGTHTLTVVTAVTNGGIWRLSDPNGAQVGSYLVQTVGAAAVSAFEVGGLAFTITDGSTDFAAGDSFTLPVVADGKLVPFVSTGVGGAQIPCAVLTYEMTKASSGNLPVRALVAGHVNKDRLIIDADGTGANVNATVMDQLRNVGIIATTTQQLADLDNQ